MKLTLYADDIELIEEPLRTKGARALVEVLPRRCPRRWHTNPDIKATEADADCQGWLYPDALSKFFYAPEIRDFWRAMGILEDDA